MEVTKQALFIGIGEAIDGNRVGDIGYAIQSYCESFSYGIVREFAGHGIGREMHEDPFVPNFGKKGSGQLLKRGMCIAIEPMVTMGNRQVVLENDDWTVRTVDRSLAAHFEHSVAITSGKADILSSFQFVEEVLRDKGF